MIAFLFRPVQRAGALTLLAFAPACTSGDSSSVDAGPDATRETSGPQPDVVVAPKEDASIDNPCDLPGSIQYTNAGATVVGGGMASAPDLSFLKLPAGFCVHYYGNVGNARQLRFAPGGELFVASPTSGTTGGGPGGQSAIMVLPDDNLDGYADTQVTFLSNLPSTQGLLFTPGHFYYQDHTKVMELAYQAGQRAAAGTPSVAVDVQVYSDGLHWPKVLDQADDGTIYVTNGSSQDEACLYPSRPFVGGIVKIDPSVTQVDDGGPGCGPGCSEVAKGFRNPIALKCAHGHDLCFALELGLDYSGAAGGREKLVPVREGDDWGFPCCGTTNVPYATVQPTPDCSTTATEIEGFTIGDTPFGLAFEGGSWPAPYAGAAFVTLHGVAGSWAGERLIAVHVDATSGMPVTGNDLTNEVDMGGMGDFATGWDDGSHMHGRPSAIAFSADGRLFVANDNDGTIFWIAPM